MVWSTRNIFAAHNLLAVSAQQNEEALNTAQVLDTTLLVKSDNILRYHPVRDNNAFEARGKEEPDRIDDRGGLVKGVLEFERAQPQHFAVMLGYGLGKLSTTAAGDTGFRHTIRPRKGDLEAGRSNPSFTAAQRLGQQVMKRRFLSCFVDQVKVWFSKDGWARLSAGILGTGKVEANTRVESLTAAYNASNLTLASLGVAGGTATERVSNVQAIKVQNPATQAWDDVAYTAVSETVPAVIAITPPGAGPENTTYRVYYLPVESGWMMFPDRVSEPPLRATQLRVNVGGTWTGSGITGGHLLATELREVSWTFNNNLQLESTPGGGGLYANRAVRRGRSQKLEFDRDFRDFLMKQYLADNEHLVVSLRAEGPAYEPGHGYLVEIVYPRVSVVSAATRMADGRLAEKVEFAVLEDDTWGSVLVTVQNQVSGYVGV